MKLLRIIFILLVFIVPTTLRAQNQSASPAPPVDDVLRVSTNLVSVPITVKTRQGAYIPNLRAEDFRIFEDGLEQQITHFEAIEKPFTVALMLDVSDSTRIELKEIQNAAIAFLNQLRPDDRCLIIAFDKEVVRLTEPTGDRKVLSDAIRQVKTGGGTALYDALDKVVNTYFRQVPGRKAIVILSDGIDTSSIRATFVTTADSANEQYALIYPIQWDTGNDVLAKQLSRVDNRAVFGVGYTTPSGETMRKAYDRGTRYLQLIAQTSGGRFQFAENLKNLERSFARIAQELRQQYSLGYYPKNQDQKHAKRRIKVSVSVPDAVIHTRENYSYRPDTP